MKKNNFLIGSLIILLLLSGVLIVKTAPAEPDATQKIDKTTSQAWTAAGRGEYQEAIRLYKNSLTELLSQKPFQNNNQWLMGLSEAYLHQLIEWYDHTSDYQALVKFLEKIDSGENEPNFQAWVTWYLGQNYLKNGKLKEAAAKFQSLNFITEWQIIGSFDNESHNGFQFVYPPEEKIDLTATLEGKKWPVQWRGWSVPPTAAGYLDFNALLYPNDKTLAYALSYVYAAETKPVALRLASDESVKIWLNDEPVYNQEIKRKSCFFDQAAVPAVLQKGWNKILVKSVQSDNGWGFRLRITEPSGAALPALTQTADKNKIGNLAVSKKETPIDLFPVSQGSLDYLEEFVRNNQRSSDGHFLLGHLYFIRQNFDIQSPLDTAEFQKAVTLESRPYFYYYLAQSLRAETSMSAEREENRYRQTLETILKINRSWAAAALELANYYYFSLGNIEKSQSYLKTALVINPDYAEARYLELQLLSAKDFGIEVNLRRKQLTERYSDIPMFRLLYAHQLTTENQIKKAEQIYQHYLKEVDYADNNVRFQLIDLYRRQGLIEPVLEECRRAAELEPYSLQPYLERIDLFEGWEDYSNALKECEQALRISPDNPNLLYQKGDYLNRLGNRPEALAAWQSALKINPNNIRLKRYLEFISQEASSFEEPFKETLETVIQKVPNTLSAGQAEESTLYYLLDQKIVLVNKEGTSRSYTHRIIKILNEKGVQDLDVVRFRYDSSRQSLKILNARVLHPDGALEEAHLNNGQAADLPLLNKGDIVDLEYKISDLRPDFFGNYFGDSFYFGTNDPTARSVYILIGPADRKFYFNQKNFNLPPVVTENDKTIVYKWEMDDIQGLKLEPLMPPAEEVIPMLQVSTYGNWPDFGRWYWQLIKRTYDFNDEMRLKLNELVPDKNVSELQKINAVYNFVISSIRYEAWEYGIHGWLPYNASTIFARKFGDCKDKALLINVFLKELGIRAEPVLINAVEDARGEEDLTLPIVEHFNHCISRVTLKDGSILWLDGTASYFSLGTLPRSDMGARVFVVNESGGELSRIPDIRPEENARTENINITLKPDGQAQLVISGSLNGEQAVDYRYYFSNQSRAELLIERLFGRDFGGAKVTKAVFSNLANLKEPVTYQWDLTIPSLAQLRAPIISGRGRELHFRPVLLPLKLLPKLGSKAERRFDLLLKTPLLQEINYDFVVPESIKIKSIPENTDIKNKFGSFSMTYQVNKNTITLAQKLRLEATRIKPADYKEFREFTGQVDRNEDKEIVLETE